MISLNVIVVPTDFSDRSLLALDYAVGLADKYDAKLKIVFVNEPGLKISDMAWVGVDKRAMDDDKIKESRRNIEEIVLKRIPAEVAADAKIIHGEAVERIIEYSKDVNADLIVMATHGRTGVSKVLLGSVAEQVVRKAPCPVLTLKQPGKK